MFFQILAYLENKFQKRVNKLAFKKNRTLNSAQK